MRPYAQESPAFAAPARPARWTTAGPRGAFGPCFSAWPRRRRSEGDIRPDAKTALQVSPIRTDIFGSAGPRRAHGVLRTEPARLPLPRMERSGP